MSLFSPLQIEMLAQIRNQETIDAAEHRRMAHQYEVDEGPSAHTRSNPSPIFALWRYGLPPMFRNSLRRDRRTGAHP